MPVVHPGVPRRQRLAALGAPADVPGVTVRVSVHPQPLRLSAPGALAASPIVATVLAFFLPAGLAAGAALAVFPVVAVIKAGQVVVA
ncbi:MAG: hypothetical protein LBH48_07380 [Bifidobacteriaceae bacterium]|nr:hypothetical protein [Bifidobacteriaceae bacterium]